MEFKNKQGTEMKVIWRGVQNSKTEPIKILSTENVEVENGEFGPVWGTIEEVKTNKGPTFIFRSEPKSYLVYASSDDVEVVKSDSYYIRQWNTGGYKNTGDQFLLCCTPGTILIVYGYNRRTYGYRRITENGVEPMEDIEVLSEDTQFNKIEISR